MSLPNCLNNLSINEIIGNNLSKLREMPSIPFLQSHDIVVDFLIKIIKKTYSLNDHDIDLLSREFKLIS